VFVVKWGPCACGCAGCRDIDDALHCTPMPNGHFEVGVRILCNTPHPTTYTPNPTTYTPNLTPQTLHPTPYTPISTLYILHPCP